MQSVPATTLRACAARAQRLCFLADFSAAFVVSGLIAADVVPGAIAPPVVVIAEFVVSGMAAGGGAAGEAVAAPVVSAPAAPSVLLLLLHPATVRATSAAVTAESWIRFTSPSWLSLRPATPGARPRRDHAASAAALAADSRRRRRPQCLYRPPRPPPLGAHHPALATPPTVSRGAPIFFGRPRMRPTTRTQT